MEKQFHETKQFLYMKTNPVVDFFGPSNLLAVGHKSTRGSPTVFSVIAPNGFVIA